MVREQKVIKSTKDNRAAFAASVVADMEAFANKHGLVLGKREHFGNILF